MQMSVGERIKQLRETVGFTQEQLADKCKITVEELHSYEENKKSPILIVAISLANALSVSVSDFIEW